MTDKPKFLIDVGVGIIVEDWLKSQDFDVQSIRNLNPKMPDVDIVKLAEKEQRIVITMDKDFGTLVYSSNLKHCGVLLLRLDNTSSVEKFNVIKDIFANYHDQLSNHFCVYQNNTLRIR